MQVGRTPIRAGKRSHGDLRRTHHGCHAARMGDATKRQAESAVARLKRHSSRAVRDGMARYGLPSDRALGVGVGAVQKFGKQLGRSQALAEALWDTEIYEARLLAAFVGEPAKLTAAAMDRWCRGFDNWGVVDTVCFKLFDQSPHALGRIAPWTKKKDEFQRRAGFVLMACVSAHNDDVTDAQLLALLPLLEGGATDERNFVKKGVSWALRLLGRRSVELNRAAVVLAQRLTESEDATARWIGKSALKEPTSAAVRKKIGI
jgi:3-methyladenine DNA glycosylase AlkD